MTTPPGDPKRLTPLSRATVDLERAYAEHRRHVFNYFRRTGMAPETADDLTQNVFTELVQSIGRYSPERGTLQSYLFGIARNLRLVHGRRERRTSWRESSGGVAPAPAPSRQAEDVAMVREAVQGLPDDFREALILREFHGLSYQEIATVQDVPVGTVRSRISRAREHLRTSLS
ncbi:MAG: RNA polymerase sigma factor [Acidobacteriota bacterium]